MNYRDLDPRRREGRREGSEKRLRTSAVLCENNMNYLSYEQAIFFYQPSCAQVQLSLRMATMVRTFQRDESWMGLVPVRIGCNDSLDVAVLAYLDAQQLVHTNDARADANNVRQYVRAIQGVQAMLNEPSIRTVEEAMLTVGILTSYERTKGASLRYLFVLISAIRGEGLADRLL